MILTPTRSVMATNSCDSARKVSFEDAEIQILEAEYSGLNTTLKERSMRESLN